MADLVQEFMTTRNLALNTYEAQTEALRKGTLIYKEDDNISLGDNLGYDTQVLMSEKDTVSGAHEHVRSGGHVGILNFADGLEPGGMVMKGAVTQEESICRSSNLYESLILPKCKEEYYKYNKKFKMTGSDRVIYSRDVLFFREEEEDGHYNHLKKPFKADVLTCPAPMSPIDRAEYDASVHPRVDRMLRIFAHEHAEILILGAWGCGAFGGIPSIVAEAFKDALKKYKGYFKLADFCIIKDSDGSESRNFKIFRDTLQDWEK